ncbi:MAG: hypothetical protein K6E69_02620 [Treponema sp.]|uniref:hypothetical protein n=1 Tax=Treponema sp. TaxID=166 RepID=UPI00298E5C5D|nr:hypothetical protein [Treponema sp.]MCR5385990.1 hypothetical protein [Treponema sp.]
MKKITLFFLIVLMSLVSCVSTKKDAGSDVEASTPSVENTQIESESSDTEVTENTGAEQTEQETISHEEDAQTNETLEEENNLAEIQFEEKINEDNGYKEESISQDELKEDIDLLNGKTQGTENAVSTNTQNEAADKQADSKTTTTPVQSETKNTAPKTAQNPAAATAPVKPAEQKPVPAQKTQTNPTTPVKESSFDLQKELSEVTDNSTQTEPEEEFIPVPSRASVIKNHQFLDIKYPGTGWIYLGELERQGLLVFYGRKVVDGNTVFTLQSKKSGTATLHFYKNDTLSQKYIDDYLTVTVGSESATDSNHEVAPDYASIVPPKPEKVVKEIPQETETQTQEISQSKKESTKPKDKIADSHTEESSEPDLNTKTRISNSDTEENQSSLNFIPGTNSVSKAESKPKTETPAEETAVQSDLLELAQKAYNEKRYEDALNLVKQFFAEATSRIDEGLYLEGQILEADSSVQDIKESISAYDTVVNNWPQSRLWKKARERSIYLKRFYIDIR